MEKEGRLFTQKSEKVAKRRTTEQIVRDLLKLLRDLKDKGRVNINANIIKENTTLDWTRAKEWLDILEMVGDSRLIIKKVPDSNLYSIKEIARVR